MCSDPIPSSQITERVIGAAFRVMNTLGVGFLEKVYANALAHELRTCGLEVEQQHRCVVHYDGVIVGDYAADMLVAGSVLVELKVAKALDGVHVAQCMNYLKATGLRLCLLMNFGRSRVEIQRVIR
jgi:GxxExxY protein